MKDLLRLGICILLPSSLLFYSCSSSKKSGVKSSIDEEKLEIIKKTIRPGEVELLVIEGVFPTGGILECQNRKIMYTVKENKLKAFLSETYFSKKRPYKCTFTHKGIERVLAEIKVNDKSFPSERLKVDKKRVFLSKKNQKRAARERALRQKAYSKSAKRPLFRDAFQLPILSKVTSIYGSRRIFNQKKQTQHLGTDFRAKVGTPIKSSNRGIVVLSRNFFYSGNTVVIDHGLGVFTTYGHLSKRYVSEGEVINKKTVIGLAGATGRVTGPHLHWGVTVNNLAVEGESLIKASQEFKY